MATPTETKSESGAEASVIRPDIVRDEYLDFLDRLRESGATNMFGAGPWLRRAFGLSEKQSHAVLSYWMKTFPRAPSPTPVSQE